MNLDMGEIIAFRGIGPESGNLIAWPDAYQYALDRCLNGSPDEQAEFQEMLVEWYYSGNYIAITDELIK